MPELSPAITDTLQTTYDTMTERTAAPEPVKAPELPKDATQAEKTHHQQSTDRQWTAEMYAVWNKANERELRELERNPPLRARHLPGVSQSEKIADTMERTLEWSELPAEERRTEAAANRHWEHAKRYLIEKGHENPSPTDIMTFMRMLEGGNQQAAQQQPMQHDPVTHQAVSVLQHFTQTNSPAEAVNRLMTLERDLRADPFNTFRKVMIEGYRTHPAQLLTPQERAQIALQYYGMPAGRVVDMAQAPHFHSRTRATVMVDDFLDSKPDATPALRQKMAELMSKLPDDGRINVPLLERLYTEAQRYRSTKPKKVTQEDTMRQVLRRHAR
jgi:hypothetical protein